MASSKNSCFNCNDFTSDPLMNGWKFITGEHAQLCYYCHSIYKSGDFGETFHSNEDGWKECESCNKLIHCGCVVSLTKYSLNNFSGLTCNDCPSTHPNVVLIPLFAKLASASDANLGISRLLIPKDYAKAYFPDYQKILVNIVDTDGKEWDNIYFRCWPSLYSKTYVLTGLRAFIISKNMLKGDTCDSYSKLAKQVYCSFYRLLLMIFTSDWTFSGVLSEGLRWKDRHGSKKALFLNTNSSDINLMMWEIADVSTKDG